MASMKALFIFDNIILRLRLISHGSRFFTLSKTFTDKSPIPCPWISRKSVFAHLNYNDYWASGRRKEAKASGMKLF